MTYLELIANIKSELKASANCARRERRYGAIQKLPEIYRAEALRKLDLDLPYVPGVYFDSQDWRAKHLAYCLFRGKTLEQIEPKRNPNLEYYHKQADHYAAKLLKEWKEEAAEDIAAYLARKAAREVAK